MRGLVAIVSLLAGCDGVFGLTHLRDPAMNEPMDAPNNGCAAPTGSSVTKLFGGRPGGLASSGVSDTFLSSDAAHRTSNFGGLDRLFGCQQCSCTTDCESISGGDDDVVTLLRFDLGAEIPPCSLVQTAKLYIHTTNDNLGGGSYITVYEVLEAWDEGASTLPGGIAGAASWSERQTGKLWTAAGAGPGSRGGTSLTTFTPSSGDSDYTVPLDSGVVQTWVDNPSKNHGVVLVVMGSTSDVHFYSSESGLTSARPAFEVTYRLP